jgi:hypothetical protein
VGVDRNGATPQLTRLPREGDAAGIPAAISPRQPRAAGRTNVTLTTGTRPQRIQPLALESGTAPTCVKHPSDYYGGSLESRVRARKPQFPDHGLPAADNLSMMNLPLYDPTMQNVTDYT